jgi:hypothetical protein
VYPGVLSRRCIDGSPTQELLYRRKKCIFDAGVKGDELQCVSHLQHQLLVPLKDTLKDIHILMEGGLKRPFHDADGVALNRLWRYYSATAGVLGLISGAFYVVGGLACQKWALLSGGSRYIFDLSGGDAAIALWLQGARCMAISLPHVYATMTDKRLSLVHAYIGQLKEQRRLALTRDTDIQLEVRVLPLFLREPVAEFLAEMQANTPAS